MTIAFIRNEVTLCEMLQLVSYMFWHCCQVPSTESTHLSYISTVSHYMEKSQVFMRIGLVIGILDTISSVIS